MKILTAIFLAAAMLLSGSASKDPEPELAAKAGSYIIRVLQASANYGSSQEEAFTAERVTLRTGPSALYKKTADLPAGTKVVILDSKTVLNTPWCQVRSGSDLGWVQAASLRSTALPVLEKNQATTKEPAKLYSSYSQGSRVMAQLEEGAELSIKRTAEFSGTQWVYATAKGYNMSGWVLVSQLNMPDTVEDADLDESETNGDYVPSFATMGIVTNNYLNIRTAPGTNFDRIGAYSGGARVGIIETNSGWGRTARGWIYLGYVYVDGQVGQNPMVGNVTADQLNVRSGPGTQYAINTTYKKGDRLLVLEQVYAGGAYWGYTRFGWVSMGYVVPDVIPGTANPIYGFGVVKDADLDVYPMAGGEGTPVSQLVQGSIVPVYVTAKVGDILWGRIPTGWICMTDVDMRAIFTYGILPPVPVDPPVDIPENPTDPTEEEKPTDPTEEEKPTDPTEEEKPTDPTEEEKPTTPTEEEKPTTPTGEEKPTTPTEEEKPTDSTEEEKPTDSTEPDTTPGDSSENADA